MNVPRRGIATGAFHSAKDRLTLFRAVDLSSGEVVLTASIGNRSADIGKFLGIAASVRYLLEHPEIYPVIYSDSLTAIAWFHDKMAVSSRPCPALHKAEVFLHAFSARISPIEVRHWDNCKWGEIPIGSNDNK
jgi:hypothetical protein